MKVRTIEIRKLLKDQVALYVIEEKIGGEWRLVRTFTKRDFADGFLEGYIQGLKREDSISSQTVTTIAEDQWPHLS